jgi:hypothetical protein
VVLDDLIKLAGGLAEKETENVPSRLKQCYLQHHGLHSSRISMVSKVFVIHSKPLGPTNKIRLCHDEET